jgi:hypothetical protein
MLLDLFLCHSKVEALCSSVSVVPTLFVLLPQIKKYLIFGYGNSSYYFYFVDEACP